jgi:5'-nucleotidase (lipoprotein e(P4) family)
MKQVAYRLRWCGLWFLILASSISAFSQTPVTQGKADNTYIEGAVLWQQLSGERIALSYQAFALARMLLDQDLKVNRRIRKPRAVIVDLDETILDNSRYWGELLKNKLHYPQGRDEWLNRAEAPATPGSVEFLRYAVSRGVETFYITNRSAPLKQVTAAHLKRLGFPNVTDQTLLMHTDPNNPSKEARRQRVGAKYRIVLLMGDNLVDFSDVFDSSRTIDGRIAAVDQNKAQFGSRFIVLPNPMYGNWENAIYDYNLKLSDAEKVTKRKSALKAFSRAVN